ncbi:hypothetical protein SAMN02745150_01286 [Brevinema andersonii]|uniref:Uncharacterized protein n=1 Tax=Brevinema andersonii TaxID=34097 RepID=A0A1I1EWG3_BREAD|nr:hypothetical protein SAMN02745150_01286 [Brevinema andersonii]
MKIQDISFVVQGYFDEFSTIKCINSLRLFPPIGNYFNNLVSI